jgi:DNA-binding NarL/FixJ family response regulator
LASSQVLHGTQGAPVRVLIADDHPVVRQGLRMMLNNDPEVDVVGEARDGDEAFDMAHKLDWDVAVFDYSMPGRGGVELLSLYHSWVNDFQAQGRYLFPVLAIASFPFARAAARFGAREARIVQSLMVAAFVLSALSFGFRGIARIAKAAGG